MKNKKKAGVFLLLAVIILVAAVVIYYKTRPKEVTNLEPEFEEAQEKPQEEGSSGGTDTGIQIPGYTSVEVQAGTKDVSVELMNPEENQVYFEISFYLPETDETIYTSKLISPGQHLYDITLERELEAGEYPLTIQYKTYSADENRTPKNGAEVNCTLIAKE